MFFFWQIPWIFRFISVIFVKFLGENCVISPVKIYGENLELHPKNKLIPENFFKQVWSEWAFTYSPWYLGRVNKSTLVDSKVKIISWYRIDLDVTSIHNLLVTFCSIFPLIYAFKASQKEESESGLKINFERHEHFSKILFVV